MFLNFTRLYLAYIVITLFFFTVIVFYFYSVNTEFYTSFVPSLSYALFVSSAETGGGAQGVDPNYATGVTDGEGNFYISIYRDKRRNGKPQIRFYFKVSQRDHSVSMLESLQKFFSCGTISVESQSKKTMRFVVNNLNDIKNVIIPHFENYPLITSKKLNFYSFKEAFNIFNEGGHLTEEGLSKIEFIQSEMNRGRSFDDKFNSIEANASINPAWLQGFTDAEGNFGAFINIVNSNEEQSNNVIEIRIKTNFNISQNIHDIGVLNSIKNFFGSGFIKPNLEDVGDLSEVKSTGLTVANFVNSHLDSIISFFDKYPLLTQKNLDYLDFKKFILLKEAKAYRTKEGLREMLDLAYGMNSGRFGESKRKEYVFPEWNENTTVRVK